MIDGETTDMTAVVTGDVVPDGASIGNSGSCFEDSGASLDDGSRIHRVLNR